MKKLFEHTAQELFQYLNETAETKQIEAKGNEDIHTRDRNGRQGKVTFRSLLESVCSFSNEPDLGGGVILLGIGEEQEDSDNRFFVEDIGDLDKAQCDIATQCKTVFNIPVYPDISIEQVDGHNVLKICVSELPATRKPLYFKQQGLPGGAYRRIGSSDLFCTDEDLYVFYQDNSSYDETPVKGAFVKDVDPDALERYRVLRAKVNPSAEELTYGDQELLEALGCVSSENPDQLTLAGVLLFGSAKLQRRVIPMVRIDYIRVPGNEWVKDPEDSFRTMDMRGPLLLLVFRVVNAVNDDLPREFHLSEGDIQAENLGLPVNALREAVVNAMMHRSYRVERPTQIIRYDNRIEIINAGYSLKDEGKYNRPGSEIRNKFLAPVFHDTNLAETKGSGIKRMREMMTKAHLAVPTFESDREENCFTARFLLHHFLGEEDLRWLGQFAELELNDHQKTALIFLRETGALDNLTYRQMNNCDTLSASHDLCAMRDMKLLDNRGKGSATYYVPGERLLEETVLNNQEQGLNNQEQGLNNQEQGLNNQEQGLNNQEQELNNQEERQKLLAKLPKELQNRILKLSRRENAEGILQKLIFDICAVTPMSKEELALCLRRNANYLRHNFLGSMIDNKLLRYSHPEVPTYRRQTYIAIQTKGMP